MGDDDVPARLTVEDSWGGWVMRRLDDGWCAALDRSTMKCTIYERRPMICAEYQMGGSDCLEERSLFSARRTPADDFFSGHDDDPSIGTLERAHRGAKVVFKQYK